MQKSFRLPLALFLALVLMLTTVTALAGGSVQPETSLTLPENGGILTLRSAPEIAVSYDEQGLVTDLTARNDTAAAILEPFTDWAGQSVDAILTRLVEAIGQAGYFVDDIEGQPRQLVIEIEPGSALPSDTFLSLVTESIRKAISTGQWHKPLTLLGETDYGVTDYVDTDYGPLSDGNTDYNGLTDYQDSTDYGPHNDGRTDYGRTDYDYTNHAKPAPKPTAKPASKPSAKPQQGTDYGRTDYSASDYGHTDYAKPTSKPAPQPQKDTDYGKTDYSRTDYGKSDYGSSDYDD